MTTRVAFVAAAVALASACAAPDGTPGGAAPAPSVRPSTAPVPSGASQARVVRVVDGDTVRLVGIGGGATGGGGAAGGDSAGGPAGEQLPRGQHRVRLIGIDAPELASGGRPAGCFATQARDWLRARLAPGAVVDVMSDRDRTDRYGRRLLYLWTRDGSHLSEEAIRLGYARVLVVRPNTAYVERLRAAERAARRERRGLWARSWASCRSGAQRDGPPQSGYWRIPWRT